MGHITFLVAAKTISARHRGPGHGGTFGTAA
jgi:hypothetical protein